MDSEEHARKAQLAYNRMNMYVTSKGCTFLTTVQEIQDHKMNSKSFYKIIGTCGHESLIKYDMFKAMDCGIKCKMCTRQSIVTTLRNKSENPSKIEYQGYCYLRDQLVQVFDIQKMVEGTQADFAIKPLNIDEDQWLPIQLKTSLNIKVQNCNNYQFKLGRQCYPNMTIVLICLEDKKAWALNGNDVIGKQTLSIGSKRSIYSQYEVTNVVNTFQNLYNTQAKQSLIMLNLPKSAQQEREQTYRRLREMYMSYLSFEYPEEESLPYDFIVNGYKVQEKVATKTKTRCAGDNIGYVVNIARSFGRKHDRKKIAYLKGDNAYYWINVPDTTLFFLFPEAALLHHGRLSIDGTRIKTSSMAIYTYDRPNSTHNWIRQYMYDYKTIAQETMMQFFATL